MKLLHYTNRPLTTVRDGIQDHTRGQGLVGKPDGLWVSVGTAWAEWCADESGWEHKHVYEVVLAPNANVLMLKSAAALDRFTTEYGYTPEFLKRLPGRPDHYIDWRRVCEKYDGIVIAPYQYSRRFVHHWYYGWDCASGCLWRAQTIDRVVDVSHLIQETVK